MSLLQETSTASVGDGKQAQSADKANRLSDEEKKVIIDKVCEFAKLEICVILSFD